MCPPSATVTAPPNEPLPARVAPLLTATVPLASEPVTFKVPPLTVAAPLRALVPLRLSTPLPFLSRLPAPLSAPPKLLSRLLPPTASVAPPATCTVPLPARLLRLALPPRLRLAPLPTVTPEVVPSAPLPAVVTLPAATVSGPLKLLLPVRSRSAAPFLISAALPASTPARVRLLLPATVRSPLRLTALASTSGVLLARVAAAPTVNAPEPRAVVLPRVSVPALSAVPPL